MVLDSNIIIYSANGNSFEELFREKNLYASVVSKTEVLGFHKLPLVTANISDFKWIEELEIINPLLSE